MSVPTQLEHQEDLSVLTSTLSSFQHYRPWATSLVEIRRNRYNRVPNQYKAMAHTIFDGRLDDLEKCIDENAQFLEAVCSSASLDFDAPPPDQWDAATGPDLDKVESTLRQLNREWSANGAIERDASYGRVLRELESLYPDRVSRHQIKVLVPGCGLGRLPLELAVRGFQSQGNEFSYHMLFTSSVILNHTQHAGQWSLRPFVHRFSNHPSWSHQTQRIVVPDLDPSVLVQHQANDPEIPEQGLLSMTAGSFDDIYGSGKGATPGNAFNVIVTVFFLDTSPNIFKTLQTIADTLETGGYWINFGPLLWHYEDVISGHDDGDNAHDRCSGLEITMEDLLLLVPQFGFDLVKHESRLPTRYTTSAASLAEFIYHCEYWVAVKNVRP